MKGESEAHESYGLLGFSRTTGGKRSLFGSSIKHTSTVTMRLFHAKKERGLNSDWHHTDGRLPIIEVEMSPTQFADIITGMNIGDGHPVTIRYLNGEGIEEYPEVKYRELFEQEFQKDMNRVHEKIASAISESKDLLKKSGTLKKEERQSLVEKLEAIERDLRSNMPFVQKSFNKQMDRTVTEAKGEVEAFVHSVAPSIRARTARRQAPEIVARNS